MSSSKNKLSAEDLEPSKGKGRVTMYMDLDVLKAVREEAKFLKLGYQTYINQILREYFINESSSNRVTTEQLLLELEALKKDVSKLKKKSSAKK